jgi:hypothetical protein
MEVLLLHQDVNIAIRIDALNERSIGAAHIDGDAPSNADLLDRIAQPTLRNAVLTQHCLGSPVVQQHSWTT